MDTQNNNIKCRFCYACNRCGTDYCQTCVQKDGTCLHLVPMSKFRDMFHYHSYYPNGYNKDSVGVYSWNSTNMTAVPTKTIYLNHDEYCPYCGNRALPLQRRINSHNDYSVTGYACVCPGSQAEIEFISCEQALKEKHEQELHDLRKEYRDRLQYDLPKLFNMWQDHRQREFERSMKYENGRSYFTSVNGHTPENIEELFFDID